MILKSRNSNSDFRDAPGRVPDPGNFHERLSFIEAVNNPAGLADDLSNHGIFEFRDDPARFREIDKPFHGLENIPAETGRGLPVELGDVLQDVP